MPLILQCICHIVYVFDSRTGHQKAKTCNPLRLQVFLVFSILSAVLAIPRLRKLSRIFGKKTAFPERKMLMKNANEFLALQHNDNTQKSYPPALPRPRQTGTPAPYLRKIPACPRRVFSPPCSSPSASYSPHHKKPRESSKKAQKKAGTMCLPLTIFPCIV